MKKRLEIGAVQFRQAFDRPTDPNSDCICRTNHHGGLLLIPIIYTPISVSFLSRPSLLLTATLSRTTTTLVVVSASSLLLDAHCTSESHVSRAMTAGSSRSRVTRLELTADQLLGSDLTRIRPYKPRKNTPKVVTVEQLLGTSLTIAGPSARSPSRTSARPAPPRSSPRPSSPRIPAAPNRERVTADEVLRTGLPVRTLQAAKARARSSSAITLTADQLLASGSGSSSGSRLSSRRGVPRVLSAEELAGPGPGYSSSDPRPRSAGGSTSAVSHTSGLRSGSGTLGARPSTAGAASSSGSSGVSASGTTRGRGPRAGQVQRSNSQGSTRTLPIYTKEPGDSEVVIDR